MGSNQKTSFDRGNKYDVTIEEHTIVAKENTSDSEKQNGNERTDPGLKPKGDENEPGLINKSKRKRNRRKERKIYKNKSKSLKIFGINCAGLMSKIKSFEKVLIDENPSVFCLQETKLKKPNQIRTDSTRNYTLYELHRKQSKGGGLCIGIHKDLRSVWISEGDDEVECLAVEVWVDDFPLRIFTGYGPQLSDSVKRKQKFWDFLEKEAENAERNGAGFILQMDSNCHIGKEILKTDINEQNQNGRLFANFLERLPHLTLINSLSICEGVITRMRKTTNGV